MESKWKHNDATINNKCIYRLLPHCFHQWLLREYWKSLQQSQFAPIKLKHVKKKLLENEIESTVIKEAYNNR